jgi:hypothetical protein
MHEKIGSYVCYLLSATRQSIAIGQVGCRRRENEVLHVVIWLNCVIDSNEDTSVTAASSATDASSSAGLRPKHTAGHRGDFK